MADADDFTIVDDPDVDGMADDGDEDDDRPDARADDLDAARVRRAASARRAIHRQRAWLSTAALVTALLAVQMAGSFVADARAHGLTARPLLSAGVCVASVAAAWVFRRRAASVGRELDEFRDDGTAEPDFTGLGSPTADERFDGLRQTGPPQDRSATDGAW